MMAHVFLAWLCKQESLVNILELCVHFIGRSKEGIVYIDAFCVYWIIFPFLNSLTYTQISVKRSIIKKYNTVIVRHLCSNFYVYIQNANFFSNLSLNGNVQSSSLSLSLFLFLHLNSHGKFIHSLHNIKAELQEMIISKYYCVS